jgi:hypothetical protein
VKPQNHIHYYLISLLSWAMFIAALASATTMQVLPDPLVIVQIFFLGFISIFLVLITWFSRKKKTQRVLSIVLLVFSSLSLLSACRVLYLDNAIAFCIKTTSQIPQLLDADHLTRTIRLIWGFGANCDGADIVWLSLPISAWLIVLYAFVLLAACYRLFARE